MAVSARVTTLQNTFHTRRPEGQPIPVFWGYTRARSEDISDGLLQLKSGQWTEKDEAGSFAKRPRQRKARTKYRDSGNEQLRNCAQGVNYKIGEDLPLR
jgi:hypothetical protein